MNQNPSNKQNDIEFEIEDLSIDTKDVEVGVKADQSIKMDTANGDSSVSNSLGSFEQPTAVSNNNASSLQADNSGDNASSSLVDSLSEDVSGTSADSSSSLESDESTNSNGDLNQPTDGATEERKSLKQRAQDTKDNLREKADQIKNAPENIKNKYNEAKDKVKDIKDKAKQVPENLRNKKEQVKNAWNNRPKSMKDVKDRMKGSNIKDKLKNGAKNRAKNMANKAKEGAKEGFKNSDLGQGIDKAKNAIDKGKKVAKGAKKAGKAAVKAGKAAGKAAAKAAQGLLNLFISTLPWSAIVVGVVLVIALIIVLICVLVPGIGGDVNEDENYSQYSKTDQKTLEKLEDIFQKYPNADGTLAMSVVLYPYFDNLYSGNVSSYLVENTDNSESEDTEEETQEEQADEDIEQEDDTVDDDPYLYPLRKSKVRKRLKKVLENLNNSSETDFKTYLKDDYFKNDGGYTWGYDEDILTGYNGYKDLLKAAGSNDGDNLYDLIIDDIYDNKDLFINYVYTNAVCASTLVDAGQIETSELLKGNILVDLKKPGCSSMKSCSESYYDNYLTLEEYVKGVVYEEIAGNTDINQIAAQMVAAKTFTLSRRTGSIMIDASTGAYVIPMLWSTADQDFCHVELGCNADDITAHYGYERGNDTRLFHGANRSAASEEQKALYNEAWNLSKNVWIVNEDGSAASVGYYAGCPSNGKCMDQEKLPNYVNIEYKSILSTFYSSYSIATVEGDVSTVQVKGTQVCTNAITNLTATRAKIVSFALEQVGKIPYYEGGLASVAGYDGNDFGVTTTDDGAGRTSKGLNSVGFVNWVYWSVIDDNLGNTNSIDNILSQGYEVSQDKLLMGDIGYSSDKTIVGIYAGDNKWIMEDAVTGNVVAKPDDRMTMFIRLNTFKFETYNYTIRENKPTSSEWGGSNMLVPPSKPSLIGECPWYAKNRAAEIITELYNNGSLTDTQYNKYLKRVKTTSGDGGTFYPGGAADNGYNGSTNIADLKAGSFIGMSSQKSDAGKKYGHVAIVEYVSEDLIVITEGWRLKKPQTYCSSYSDFSCVEFRHKTFNSYQEFYNYYHDPNGYMMKGYLYFLED